MSLKCLTPLINHYLFFDANDGHALNQVSVKEDLLKEAKQAIICALCGTCLCTSREKAQKDGSFEHVFINPAGIVYRIGIFRKLNHILTNGVPESFFTWFPGYSWDCIYCAVCLSHLGWLFASSPQDFFYGVILNNIKGY